MKTLFGSDIRVDSRFRYAVSDFGGESTIGARMASPLALSGVNSERGARNCALMRFSPAANAPSSGLLRKLEREN